jgi:hypothetical protein
MTWKGFFRGWAVFSMGWLGLCLVAIGIFEPGGPDGVAQGVAMFAICVPVISLIFGVLIVGISKEGARNEASSKTDSGSA